MPAQIQIQTHKIFVSLMAKLPQFTNIDNIPSVDVVPVSADMEVKEAPALEERMAKVEGIILTILLGP